VKQKNGKIDVGVTHQESEGQDYAIKGGEHHLKLLQIDKSLEI